VGERKGKSTNRGLALPCRTVKGAALGVGEGEEHCGEYKTSSKGLHYKSATWFGRLCGWLFGPLPFFSAPDLAEMTWAVPNSTKYD